ncbi:GNAT family N-acetyltransferase [Natronobacterium haloterrestre]
MPGHAFLRGPNVALRPMERTECDRAALCRVRNEPAFRRTLGFDKPWPGSRVDAFLESVATDDSSSNLFVCPSHERRSDDGRTRSETAGGEDGGSERGSEETVSGAVNLFDVDGTAGTLSYWLFDEYRGRGYATEAVSLLVEHAFEELGLHRVEAEVFDGNDPSRRLLERVGFVGEGVSREARFTGGEFRDVHRFGLLAPEWDGRGEP